MEFFIRGVNVRMNEFQCRMVSRDLVKRKSLATTTTFSFIIASKMANAHTVLETEHDDLNTSAWVGDTFQVEKGALVPFSSINTMSPIKEQL